MIQLTATRKFQLKLLASCVLLAVILFSADWKQVWQVLQQVNWVFLLLIAGLFVLIVLVSAWKWWWLLCIHSIPFAFADLSRWYFIAFFFNNFLPSSIGGDGFRIYRTLSNNRGRSTAVVAVVVERLSGLVILLALGFIAAAVSYQLTSHAFSSAYFVFGSVALLFLSAFLALAWKTNVMRKVASWRTWPDQVKGVISHITDYQNNRIGTVAVVLISLLFHAINIAALWMLSKAVGAEISIIDLTIVVTSVNIISILPISINGIGLVDGAFVYMLSLYGVDTAQGVSFSILLRFLVLPISVAGMCLYLSDKRATSINAAV